MSSELGPCQGCKITIMLEEGCCTTDVGFGTKIARVGKRKIEVCKNLGFDPEVGLFCETYFQRPPECRAFECELILDARA